jgi:hypothetical protein
MNRILCVTLMRESLLYFSLVFLVKKCYDFTWVLVAHACNPSYLRG